MEEILLPLAQILVEFFIEFAVYFGVDFAWKRENGRAGCGYYTLMVVLGAVLGWVMNLVHPHLFMHTTGLRIAALIASPLAAGGTSYLIARWRRTSNPRIEPADHFWSGFTFVLAFNLIRFAFGTR